MVLLKVGVVNKRVHAVLYEVATTASQTSDNFLQVLNTSSKLPVKIETTQNPQHCYNSVWKSMLLHYWCQATPSGFSWMRGHSIFNAQTKMLITSSWCNPERVTWIKWCFANVVQATEEHYNTLQAYSKATMWGHTISVNDQSLRFLF